MGGACFSDIRVNQVSLTAFPLSVSVHVNPSKQHLLEKKAQYEEGQIRTPELLSSDDLCRFLTRLSLSITSSGIV